MDNDVTIKTNATKVCATLNSKSTPKLLSKRTQVDYPA